VHPDEISIRLGAFVVMFVSIAVWEAAVPRRKRSYSRLRRWPSNLAVSALNQVLLRLVLSFTIVASAIIASDRGWGIFNNISAPQSVAVTTSVVLLDLVIYSQHVLFHAVSAFWRFHRVHHADLDFDVSTGVRFHPFEILLSALIKSSAVVVLGAPAVSVIIFEVLLNSTSMFNHGNVRIAESIDRLLRWILVTPDMHRVHHSILPKETNSNFGFNLAFWDRLFGTYQNQPAAGHERMTIGIEQFRDIRELLLDRMLLQPFRRASGEYPRLFRGDA
jgi:sterol desaturase/sphingolipid hydroxylase (fatty acid hydroxylase superfamily)